MNDGLLRQNDIIDAVMQAEFAQFDMNLVRFYLN
jgi:hypothetical protein